MTQRRRGFEYHYDIAVINELYDCINLYNCGRPIPPECGDLDMYSTWCNILISISFIYYSIMFFEFLQTM